MISLSPIAPAAYRDRTVSKIRAKYENRFTFRFNEEAERLLRDEIGTTARGRFLQGKWLERHHVTRMEDLFRKVYQDAPYLLISLDEERPGTRVKPRSWAVCHARLHVAADDDDRFVRLHAARFLATRKSVEHSISRSTHGWTFHAQERLHQRTPDDVRADRLIGSAIMDNAAVIEMLCEDNRDLAGVSFAIPCHEGLLLGTLKQVDLDLEVGRRVRATDYVYSTGTLTLGNMLRLEEGEPLPLSFVGLTYVGPDEMRDEQFELRDRLEAIGADFLPMSQAITTGFLGFGIDAVMPDAKGKAPVGKLAAVVDSHRPDHARMKVLGELLRDERMILAMGN